MFFSENMIAEGYRTQQMQTKFCITCKRRLSSNDRFKTLTGNDDKLHYECISCIEKIEAKKENLAYEVRKKELDLWWENEQNKPRKPHPSYYYEHTPFGKCRCDFCKSKS